jgi:hypothetical protein
VSTYVTADNIGAAWLLAYQALMQARGRQLVNLAVSIDNPLSEDVGIRSALEHTLARLLQDSPKSPWHSVHTVANTIFPISLYHPNLPEAANRFFMHSIDASRARRGRRQGWGTYIGRLVDYEGRDGARVNQLDTMLRLLREKRQWADIYETPLTYACETSGESASANADLHLIGPGDRRRRGGPCLAHISLTANDGSLHLTAQYRRHSYIGRAYGNFLGLARLLNFLAHESGREVGGMLVVGTHAEVEGIAERANLLEAATRAQGQVQPIETFSRPLGASWRDLDLPSLVPRSVVS